MLENHGRRVGFDDGYRDAAENKREKPKPSLGASLLSIDYLDAYTQAYRQGYVQAERDIAAIRQAIVAREAHKGLDRGDRNSTPDDRATALLRDRIGREQRLAREPSSKCGRSER